MAEEIVGFDDSTAERILRATRKVENSPPLVPPAPPVAQQALADRPGVWVKNTSSEAVPAYGCIGIVSFDNTHLAELDDIILTGEKPSSTYRELYLFNDREEIPTGEVAWVYLDQEKRMCLYDPGWSIAAGDIGGPRAGYWTLHKNYRGFVRALGPFDTTNYLGFFQQMEPNRIFPVTLGSSVTDGGTAASVSLPDGRTVSAVNKSGMTLTAGNATVYQSLHDGAWYLTGARSSGGGGGGGSRFFEAELDGDLCSTDATTFVTNAVAIDGLGSEPSDPEVLNDFTEWGSSGDKCLIVESPGLEISYLLVRVEHAQPDELLPGTLSGTLALTDSTASVVVDGDTVTATNSLSLAGPNGAYCEVLKTGCGDDLEYRLINVKHYDCES